MKKRTDIVIYQARSGKIEFKGDFKEDTVWGNLSQIAELFEVQKPAVSKHLKNIYEEGELDKKATVSILETVQTEGNRKVARRIEYYNLDAILSVGYRINSKKATRFRIWATKTLKQHLIEGYTLNKNRIAKNYDNFLRAVSGVKAVLPKNSELRAEELLEIINAFAGTWLSLDAYDTESFPKRGATKREVSFTAEEFIRSLKDFRRQLIANKQASELFGQEQQKSSIEGIVGNIFQSFDGEEVYPTVEEKAAHLLYFMVKNHPFIDGNKRSGAFSFVWFLRRAGVLRMSITAEALTALTLLIAESNPKEKNKMIGLILLLLKE